jgi:dimethylhistidine N-methyltransferase
MTDDILDGLRAPQKTLPCRLLYDARGAELFEQITELDEYYLTRDELALLAASLPAIADAIGPNARVIEPGSGAGKKTRMLLDALATPVVYVPIDVSAQQLADTAETLRVAYPGLDVAPVHADYTQRFALPVTGPFARSVVFFPGSTIGNFEPDDARDFLGRFGKLAGPGSLLVLGADSNGDVASLLRAYDDPRGVTAEFDLNMLLHLNRTRDATFDLGAFVHRATWDPTRSRIEMRLLSRRRQSVTVGGERIDFERGESIVTEHCYKHRPEVLASLLDAGGWHVRHVFPDPRGRMRLWLAER